MALSYEALNADQRIAEQTARKQWLDELQKSTAEQGLKGQCHEIYDLYIFFSWIEPIWAPDKQSKMVFLKNLFSRIMNLKLEKFDSAQTNTARSRIF